MTEYGRIHTDGSRSGGDGELLRVDIDDGKYTFIQRADGGSHVLRYSEPWLAELPVGSNCWLAMAYELQALRQPTQSSVAAAGTDRIGGGGGLPCGVVGVATQSDADLLEEMRFTYETVCSEGYNDPDYTEDLDFEIEARGWEAAFAVAVAKLRQPTQSDALKAAGDAIRGLLDIASDDNLDSEQAGRAYAALHDIGTALKGQSK